MAKFAAVLRNLFPNGSTNTFCRDALAEQQPYVP